MLSEVKMESPDLKSLSLITASLERLQLYIEQEAFKGYDPYDTLTSPVPFHLLGRYGQAIATQIQKRNPLNIRPLLGIKKNYNPKGIGLLLNGYSLLQQHFPEKNYHSQMDFLFNWLNNNKSKDFKNACWGYNFGWASPEKYLPPFAPTVVATAFIAKGLYAYYLVSGNEEALSLLKSCAAFILEDLPFTTTEDGLCYSYSPFMKDCCYNASLLAAETLALVWSLSKEETLKTKAIAAVDFVVAHQHTDGHWKYKINPETGMERHQVDFHQGYIIDSIRAVIKYTGVSKTDWENAIAKGAAFYMQEQFFPDGRSKWRIPKIYPVEIHNQTQGIITFSRLYKTEKYFTFAGEILKWTLQHMQDQRGYFYYRKFPFYTNKISFMRWSNAWMFLAMAEYIDACKNRQD